MDALNKIIELAPAGVRQALLCFGLAVGLFWFAHDKSETAFSTIQDLHAAHTRASSLATTIGLPNKPDKRLDGELVTITPPTIEQRQQMLKNFEAMRSVLTQSANEEGATPEYKAEIQGVVQAYNETQDKYLRWCQAQDNYEPFRKWSGFAYLVLAVGAIWGLGSWWRSRPKKQSKLILPASLK